MSGKPKFVFFKMLNCGHCNVFFSTPDEKNSTWGKLTADAELKNKVEMVMIEWGGIYGPDKSLLAIKEVPPEYKTIGPEGKGVTYGPFFYFHEAGKPQNGIELRNIAREYQTMKKWILSNVPTFVGSPSPQKMEQSRGSSVVGASGNGSPGGVASQVKTQQPQRRQARAKPLVELGPPTPGKPMILNQGKLQELPLEVQNRLERKPVNMVAAPKDFAAKEMEPRYVPAERRVNVSGSSNGRQSMNATPGLDGRPQQVRAESRTKNPNLQPYVQALSNSTVTGYQNSDVARFKANTPSNGSKTTMNKSELPAGTQRRYIARNHRK